MNGEDDWVLIEEIFSFLSFSWRKRNKKELVRTVEENSLNIYSAIEAHCSKADWFNVTFPSQQVNFLFNLLIKMGPLCSSPGWEDERSGILRRGLSEQTGENAWNGNFVGWNCFNDSTSTLSSSLCLFVTTLFSRSRAPEFRSHLWKLHTNSRELFHVTYVIRNTAIEKTIQYKYCRYLIRVSSWKRPPYSERSL